MQAGIYSHHCSLKNSLPWLDDSISMTSFRTNHRDPGSPAFTEVLACRTVYYTAPVTAMSRPTGSWNFLVKHFLAEELKTCSTIHQPLVRFDLIHGSFHRSLGTNCQLHLITRMVNRASSSPIPFIPFVVKASLCCRNALPGEKSGLLSRPTDMLLSLPNWDNYTFHVYIGRRYNYAD